MSVADIMCFYDTSNLYYYGKEGWLDEFPKVKEWYKKIEALPEVSEIQKEWYVEDVKGYKEYLASILP